MLYLEGADSPPYHLHSQSESSVPASRVSSLQTEFQSQTQAKLEFYVWKFPLKEKVEIEDQIPVLISGHLPTDHSTSEALVCSSAGH